MVLLIPPEQFGIVEKGIYRSDMLHPSHFPFIKSLNIKIILVLSPEVPARSIMGFIEENKIKLIHLGTRVWKPILSWRPVSEELIKDGLELILDVKNYPILVLCTYAGNKSRYVNEQFIELFDMDLITLPKDLPSWFIEQKKLWEEEEEELNKQYNKKV
ncbi:12505_t:CDS:2 [Entrophospora sp. SA101]|nr:9379_t:CDS:2 [Entrophospora candida]CAG8469945.1 10583_t:CDS:2 [Entrophospora candida]CAJ0626611.1 12505_t:CDS:2 [Entrophospora sp. SA101]CAJ0861607.1 8260_t:CDS:2 [Entrophospora sp. SA101]